MGCNLFLFLVRSHNILPSATYDMIKETTNQIFHCSKIGDKVDVVQFYTWNHIWVVSEQIHVYFTCVFQMTVSLTPYIAWTKPSIKHFGDLVNTRKRFTKCIHVKERFHGSIKSHMRQHNAKLLSIVYDVHSYIRTI